MATTTTNATCITPMAATSNGVWQGDNPMHFALPLLSLQIALVLIITRLLAFLFKPMRQPRVIAEIVGGILLGPSAFGRNTTYLNVIFPVQSISTLSTIANMGLLFFLFMVGLELDLRQIRKTGRKAMAIAAAGISLPFVAGVGVSFVLHQTIAPQGKFGAFLVFMGVAMSITAFPVLARILAERKLLTTDVGQLAMSAAAVNDVVAWILLALAVALSGSGKSPTIVVWVLLCAVGFVLFMFFLVRPVMKRIALHSTSNDPVKELYVCITLAGVLVAGFCTDAIGIHSIFGAFLFGLIIPKEGPFSGILVEKLEDFVSILMLPLYFALSGLNTNIGSIHSAQSGGLLVLVIVVACFGKITGTFLAAIASKLMFRKAITLGILMNTKGLVELIVLNIGKERGVLNDETFAIMVLMALFTTFMTTPLLMVLYKPARNPIPYTHRKLDMDDSINVLRILSCVHGMKNVPAMINLTEAMRGRPKHALRLYTLHLVELSERTSSILLVQRARRDGRPYFNQGNQDEDRDQVVVAFKTYGQLSKVTVRPMTAISRFEDMHEDICATASDKRIMIIILPFHKQLDGILESTTPGFQMVNQKVLQHAPCSVAILVDRGVGGVAQLLPSNVDHKVVVFFFGGPDDREALAYGCHLVEHPGITLHVIQFADSRSEYFGISMLPPCEGEVENITNMNRLAPTSPGCSYESATQGLLDQKQQQQQLDKEAIATLICRQEKVNTTDRTPNPITLEHRDDVADPIETILEVSRTSMYDLILVGRSRRPTPFASRILQRDIEYSELGPIGDALISPSNRASVLVFQQHDPMLVTSLATTTTQFLAQVTTTTSVNITDHSAASGEKSSSELLLDSSELPSTSVDKSSSELLLDSNELPSTSANKVIDI